MEQRFFQLHEYVWDLTWESPAIVVQVEDARYLAAEIDPQRRLGRVAWREAGQLRRYVRVLLPEEEAIAVISAAAVSEYREALGTARNRIAKALMERGVEVSESS